MYPLLCIPTSKCDMLWNHNHSSLVGGHTGVTECYVTISQRCYCPNLTHHIRAYITGCHICQMLKQGKQTYRPLREQINLNTPTLTEISMNIKYMPSSIKQYKYILVLLCQMANFLVALPLKITQTADVCNAIIGGYIRYFGSPRSYATRIQPLYPTWPSTFQTMWH